MIRIAANFFDSFAKVFGIPVRMPRPGKEKRTVSAAANSALGIGLIIGGVLRGSKSLIGLGVIGIIGAIFLKFGK